MTTETSWHAIGALAVNPVGPTPLYAVRAPSL